jgi:hypothetical protein
MFKNILILSVLVAFSGCSGEVNMVKDGALQQYSNSLSVDNTLNGWMKTQHCSQPNWTLLTTERKEKIVQFTCDINLDTLRTREDMASSATEEDAEYMVAAPAATEDIAQSEKDWAEFNKIEATRVANEKIVAKKALSKVQILIKFPLSIDGKTFTVSDQSVEYYFIDGQKNSDPKELLRDIYKNVKINLTNSIVPAYQSRG